MHWKNRPDGSNWGDFGADDQRGRLNLLTPQKVLEGIAEVREGRSFCLSMALNLPGKNVLNPRRHPPVHQATHHEGTPFFGFRTENLKPEWTDVICDDAILIHMQYSTQWDSLAHVGSVFDADGDGEPENVFYNGFRHGEHVVGPEGDGVHGVHSDKLGIENMATSCVQGRGVMIDLKAHVGEERAWIDWNDLEAIMKADDVTVEPGDMVLFHTGLTKIIVDGGMDPDGERIRNSCAVLNGRDPKIRDWVTNSDVVCLISDNYAVEGLPARSGEGRHAMLPLHEHCLFKLGIHLGELWWLHDLADWLRRNNRNRFLLTAPPLNLPGAVGSPATPVATV